jgi:ABC-type transporter Mla MlaB component
MLRVEVTWESQLQVLRLIGELRVSELEQLEPQVNDKSQAMALDLDELRLVDLAAVRFLIWCEARGVEIRNCPPYVREWMSRERAKETGQ